MKSNGGSTQSDVVALNVVKWILYNWYSRCTWCNQMDVLHAVMKKHLIGPNECFTRGAYIGALGCNDLVQFRVQMDALLNVLQVNLNYISRWIAMQTDLLRSLDVVLVWMLYRQTCGCTPTPGHYGCLAGGPIAVQ